MVEAATTCDAFYAGRLLLTQPTSGHRSGTDAVLLAAAVPVDFDGLAIDAGSGVGAAGLGVAITCDKASVLLIENDATAARLCADNIVANRLDARARIIQCDLLDRDQRRAKITSPADLVITNPPFYEAHAVRISSSAARGAAHVLAPGTTLADWIAACTDMLGPKGTLIMIHRTSALPDALSAMGRRLGALTVMPIHNRPGEPPKRVLMRGTMGSRAPFSYSRPLPFTRVSVLRGRPSVFTRASIDWRGEHVKTSGCLTEHLVEHPHNRFAIVGLGDETDVPRQAVAFRPLPTPRRSRTAE